MATRLPLALMLVLPAVTQPAPRADLVIRAYQQGEYSRALAVELQHALARLLVRSGISLAIIDCTGLPCQHEWASHELVLRLVAGRHRSNPNVCGIAHGGAVSPGIALTVFRGCVAETTGALRSMAARGRSPVVLLKLTEVDLLAPIVVHI